MIERTIPLSSLMLFMANNLIAGSSNGDILLEFLQKENPHIKEWPKYTFINTGDIDGQVAKQNVIIKFESFNDAEKDALFAMQLK